MDTMLESRLGKLFIIIYALFSIAMYAISFFCGASSCALAIVVPIMPWAYILTQDFNLAFPWAIYPIFVLLNVSVAYVVGAAIEWLYHWYEERKEDTGGASVVSKKSV